MAGWGPLLLLGFSFFSFFFLPDPPAGPFSTLTGLGPGGTLTHEEGQNNPHQMREAPVERDAKTLSDKSDKQKLTEWDCLPTASSPQEFLSAAPKDEPE